MLKKEREREREKERERERGRKEGRKERGGKSSRQMSPWNQRAAAALI